jgi:hypothetical protein
VKKHSLKVRFLALFVTVFVCLNGAGAACVAYCQTMDAPEESADHCPLKKLSTDCETDSKFAAVQSGEFDCCPMTVSFFAAPVEKSSFSIKQAAAVPSVHAEPSVLSFRSFTPLRSSMSYRGPPPLDRRPDRIKHRLLLI